MSIQQVQTKNILELIAQSFMVNGTNPQLSQLYTHLSTWFSRQPAGRPVTFDVDIFRKDAQSDPDLMNDFMCYVIVNLDTLYEVCQQHVDQIMMLNTILRTHLDRLKTRRDILSSRIDDYLLGIYNSDGYFYSFSDGFYNTQFVDFQYTTASVDTLSDMVGLSPVSSKSVMVNNISIGSPTTTVTNAAGENLTYKIKTDFANAIDGMTNTAWYFEVRTTDKGPITAKIDLSMNNGANDNVVTEINITPYGVTEVQCGVNAVFSPDGIQNNYTKAFSNKVITSANKMKFIGDQITDRISSLTFQLTKTKADYILNDNNNSNTNVFVFGFKELLMAEQYYDSIGVMVTTPFGITADLKADAVIDAVSIVVEDHIPTNTTLTYYIAEDNIDALALGDFDWKEITPISNLNPSSNNVVHFGGSAKMMQNIRLAKRTQSDLLLTPLNTTDPDLAKRNPSPSFFPGIDIYRITEFKDDFLKDTTLLEEGINTTKIYYTALDTTAVTKGFDYWALKFNDSTSYSTTYGEIDSGHEFFYGADVGEAGKSIYVETYLEAIKEYPVILKDCRKSDVNSQTWDIRVFLNGNEIANMPRGVNKLTVPWKFKEGKNHIVVMANVPAATVAVPSPYIGTFNVMSDAQLTDYGIIKLGNWTYVDNYKFLNNQINDPYSFTIYNNQIVSRRKPTNNFRLTYNKSTDSAPESLRLRVDFTRDSQYARATPLLDSYRVRFAYK